MTNLRQFRVVLVLGLSCLAAAYGRSLPALTETEALRELKAYRGSVERLHATFPQVVSDGPPLTSMGPTSLSDSCYAGWRATMAALQRKGYLSSFLQADHKTGFSVADVTPKGKAFFGHVTAGSFYGTVRIVPDLATAEPPVGAITLSTNGKRAQVEFRMLRAEPFRIMGENELLADGCGIAVDPAVVIDREGVAGHAHFQFHKDGWRIERVLLGEHVTEE